MADKALSDHAERIDQQQQDSGGGAAAAPADEEDSEAKVKEFVSQWLPYLPLVVEQAKFMGPLWSWQERLERLMNLLEMVTVDKPWHPKLLSATGWREDYFKQQMKTFRFSECKAHYPHNYHHPLDIR